MKTNSLATFAVAAALPLLAACPSSNVDPVTGLKLVKTGKPILTMTDEVRAKFSGPVIGGHKPAADSVAAEPAPQP